MDLSRIHIAMGPIKRNLPGSRHEIGVSGFSSPSDFGLFVSLFVADMLVRPTRHGVERLLGLLLACLRPVYRLLRRRQNLHLASMRRHRVQLRRWALVKHSSEYIGHSLRPHTGRS